MKRINNEPVEIQPSFMAPLLDPDTAYLFSMKDQVRNPHTNTDTVTVFPVSVDATNNNSHPTVSNALLQLL